MPNPERPAGEHPVEPDLLPRYHRAVRFPNERTCRQAYAGAQRAIYTHRDNDLSTFQLQWQQREHVAVLGEPPPEELEQQLTRILARGEAVSLPDELLQVLHQRRLAAVKQAGWVERHFRPGQVIPYEPPAASEPPPAPPEGRPPGGAGHG